MATLEDNQTQNVEIETIGADASSVNDDMELGMDVPDQGIELAVNQPNAANAQAIDSGDIELSIVGPNEGGSIEINQQNQEQIIFHKVKYETIYFQDYLSPEWTNSNHVLPRNIVDTRNKKIVLCYLEVVMDIAAIVFCIMRQSQVTIFFTVGNLAFLSLGIWASLRLNYWGLVLHTTWTLGVIGGFVIFKVFDTIAYMSLDRDPANQNTGQINRTTVRVISTLPQLFILAIGVFGCILVLRLDDEIQARKKYEEEQVQEAESALKDREQKKNNSVVPEEGEENAADLEKAVVSTDDQEKAAASEDSNQAEVQPQDIFVECIKIEPVNMGNDKCAYCCNNQKTIVFYPCGHKVLCEECCQKFQNQAKHLICPICLIRIKDMIKVNK